MVGSGDGRGEEEKMPGRRGERTDGFKRREDERMRRKHEGEGNLEGEGRCDD